MSDIVTFVDGTTFDMSEFKILYSKLDKDEYTQVEKLKIVNQLSQMFEDYNISLSSSIRIKGEIINHKRWTFVDKIFFKILCRNVYAILKAMVVAINMTSATDIATRKKNTLKGLKLVQKYELTFYKRFNKLIRSYYVLSGPNASFASVYYSPVWTNYIFLANSLNNAMKINLDL